MASGADPFRSYARALLGGISSPSRRGTLHLPTRQRSDSNLSHIDSKLSIASSAASLKTPMPLPFESTGTPIPKEHLHLLLGPLVAIGSQANNALSRMHEALHDLELAGIHTKTDQGIFDSLERRFLRILHSQSEQRFYNTLRQSQEIVTRLKGHTPKNNRCIQEVTQYCVSLRDLRQDIARVWMVLSKTERPSATSATQLMSQSARIETLSQSMLAQTTQWRSIGLIEETEEHVLNILAQRLQTLLTEPREERLMQGMQTAFTATNRFKTAIHTRDTNAPQSKSIHACSHLEHSLSELLRLREAALIALYRDLF